jgi:hypothetical protein
MSKPALHAMPAQQRWPLLERWEREDAEEYVHTFLRFKLCCSIAQLKHWTCEELALWHALAFRLCDHMNELTGEDRHYTFNDAGDVLMPLGKLQINLNAPAYRFTGPELRELFS